MTDDEIIAVVQAYKEGKTIQVVGKWEADKDINWRDVQYPEWQFGTALYRVKPEPRKPREWIIHIPRNGVHGEISANLYPPDSLGHDFEYVADKECLKVREVIE